MILKIDNINVFYGNIHALRDVSLEVNEGEIVALIGANGAGKSTLLKLITGIIKSPKDTIIRQKNLKISYVDQVTLNNDSTFPATVKEILEMSIPHNFWGIVTFKRDEKIKKAVDYLKISDLLNKKMQELSGGQQQKVRLAKALLNQPNLLILDEPTTGIDVKSQEEFLKKIQEIHSAGTAIIIISHRKEDLSACKKVYVLNDEHLEEKNV